MAYNEYSSTRGYCCNSPQTILPPPTTLQRVVNNGDSLQGQHPTEGQTMGFDGNNVIWGVFKGTIPTLQEVLTAGHTSNQPVRFNYDNPIVEIGSTGIIVGEPFNDNTTTLTTSSITLNIDQGDNLIVSASEVNQNGNTASWGDIIAKTNTTYDLQTVLSAGNTANNSIVLGENPSNNNLNRTTLKDNGLNIFTPAYSEETTYRYDGIYFGDDICTIRSPDSTEWNCTNNFTLSANEVDVNTPLMKITGAGTTQINGGTVTATTFSGTVSNITTTNTSSGNYQVMLGGTTGGSNTLKGSVSTSGNNFYFNPGSSTLFMYSPTQTNPLSISTTQIEMTDSASDARGRYKANSLTIHKNATNEDTSVSYNGFTSVIPATSGNNIATLSAENGLRMYNTNNGGKPSNYQTLSSIILTDISGTTNSTMTATSLSIGNGTGTMSGTSTKVLVTDKNTSGTYYLPFVDGAGSKSLYIDNTTSPLLTYEPSNSILTASKFVGDLSGSATNISIIGSNDTSGTYFLPFVDGSGNRPLYIDDVSSALTYNPSTSNLTASSYTITGTPSTATVAPTFGQIGLVYLQTVTANITGTASVVNFNLSSIFNTTYKNYRIVLSPTTQLSTTYPSYALSAFLGTSPPTTAGLYGVEMTSLNTVTVSPVFTAVGTFSSSPLVFAVSSVINKQVVFEVSNVGYAYTASQIVTLSCKSTYSNPTVNGTSDRTIQSTGSSGTTITGLTIQQSSIGVGNNLTLQAIVYGYNTI